MNPRLLMPLIVVGILFVFLYIGLSKDPTKVDSPFIDKAAPAFSLPGLRNPQAVVSNELFKGKVSLVNVWATWCGGCRQEHDTLVEISKNKDVPIIGLNWKDNGPAAIQWLDKLGDPYAITGFDAEGRVAIDWGVYGAPETFLVDAQGIVRHKLIGPMSLEIWQRDFMPLITRLQGDK